MSLELLERSIDGVFLRRSSVSLVWDVLLDDPSRDRLRFSSLPDHGAEDESDAAMFRTTMSALRLVGM